MEEISFWSSMGEKEEDRGRDGGAGKLMTTIKVATININEIMNPCNLIRCSKYGIERSSVKAANIRAIK